MLDDNEVLKLHANDGLKRLAEREANASPVKPVPMSAQAKEDMEARHKYEAELEEKRAIRDGKGRKHDAGKIRWSLLPWGALEEVVKVLEHGAQKYSPGNWVKVEPERYEEALLRHVVARQKGEKNDPDSKLSHLAHIVCDALFLIWFELRGKV